MSPLYGLVLAGGRSTRMGQDKAGLLYGDAPQLEAAYRRLRAVVDKAFVSVRQDQHDDPLRAGFPQIVDAPDTSGPAAGLLAAHAARPDAVWLVLACDLPLLDDGTIENLIAARDGTHMAIAYRSEHDGLPEPLCTLWEPAGLEALKAQLATGRNCPRKCLINNDTLLLPPHMPGALDNINTPQEREDALRRLETTCRA
ncbi:NTP transferase domain-containing protein [Brytella acorum]|uniref:Molybdenum cofactor guanylyltransferase n=1 Tax=Brytella acorum TaxID=2959299 RepID=A0AA35Y2P3_9PROT|nr:NTP transferase domain-containing protein [Brytella acorum]MDF3624748.1 NTP transferase domain-containing protein [Brytella acorum]CAI9120051.1 NTP transferase domain-containing protein [Brytella acorum]